MNPWAIVTSNQCHYNLQYSFPYYNFARGGKWNWNKQQFKIIVFALKLTGTESTLQEESKGSKYLNGQSKGSLVKKLIKKKASSCCSKKILYKRLPVLNFIRNYNLDFFISDMLAGLTVGLTAVPQGIAYAVVAGLEPQVTTWFWLFFMKNMIHGSILLKRFLWLFTVRTLFRIHGLLYVLHFRKREGHHNWTDCDYGSYSSKERRSLQQRFCSLTVLSGRLHYFALRCFSIRWV